MPVTRNPPSRTAWTRFFHGISVWVSALALIACAFSLLPGRLQRVKNQHDIGHADGVAYAWQGRSLSEGRGWDVPYVTGFFHAYPRTILRPDDQWPPLLPFVLAPAFKLFGADASVLRATNLVIATLLLPFSVWFLVFSVTGRGWMGLLAALPLLGSFQIYEEGTGELTDLLLTAVCSFFLASLIQSRKHPAWLLASGVFYALAWYGKGSHILLGGILGAAVLLLHGPRALIHRWHLGAWLLALLLMFPRLRENARDFGNPLHSTQNYVSSFFGLSADTWTQWDNGFYSIWWGRDLPGPSNRFDHPALHARSMRRNSEVFLRVLFLGLDAEKTDWQKLGAVPAGWQRSLTAPGARPENISSQDPRFTAPSRCSFPAQSLLHLTGMLWGLVSLPLLPLLWWWHRRTRDTGSPAVALPQAQSAWILLAFALLQSFFITVFWHAMDRLVYPVWPAVCALGWSFLALLWTGIVAGTGRIPERFRSHRVLSRVPLVASFLLSLLVAGTFVREAPRLHAKQEAEFRHPPPTKTRYPHTYELGRVMAAELPARAVIMCRNTWQTLWYAPETFRGVGLPMALPPELLSVAKYYGVTHLILDKSRPGLRAFIKSNPGAFRQVISKPYPVYAIDYSALPEGTLVPLGDIKPFWDPRTGLKEDEELLRKARATVPTVRP
jgi:hypothetical protein